MSRVALKGPKWRSRRPKKDRNGVPVPFEHWLLVYILSLCLSNKGAVINLRRQCFELAMHRNASAAWGAYSTTHVPRWLLWEGREGKSGSGWKVKEGEGRRGVGMKKGNGRVKLVPIV